jgi:3',5'-cyclic-AMP phosphodiesterase
MLADAVVVQLSDCHVGATWGARDPEVALARIGEAIEALPARVDAILISGDLAEHAEQAEYDVVRDAVGRLGAPVYVTTGNHDEPERLRATFPDVTVAAGPYRYAVHAGGLRLVTLDTRIPGDAAGRLDRAQLAWLEETLGESAAPTILAMHHPPFLTGVAAFDRMGLPPEHVRALGEIVERHRQVRCVVAGHIHRAATGSLAGRPALTAPSVYSALRLDQPVGELEIAEHEPAGFAVHALLDGAITSHLMPVRP